jgi:hypothetical protein
MKINDFIFLDLLRNLLDPIVIFRACSIERDEKYQVINLFRGFTDIKYPLKDIFYRE